MAFDLEDFKDWLRNEAQVEERFAYRTAFERALRKITEMEQLTVADVPVGGFFRFKTFPEGTVHLKVGETTVVDTQAGDPMLYGPFVLDKDELGRPITSVKAVFTDE